MKEIVIFVCMGNILRSVLAEKLFNATIKTMGLQAKFQAISRGIQGSQAITPKMDSPEHDNITKYPRVWKIQKSLLEKLNIDLRNHISRPIDAEILHKAILVIVMDEDAYNLLIDYFPTLQDKIILRNIPDAGGSHDLQFHENHNKGVVKIIEEGFESGGCFGILLE